MKTGLVVRHIALVSLLSSYFTADVAAGEETKPFHTPPILTKMLYQGQTDFYPKYRGPVKDIAMTDEGATCVSFRSTCIQFWNTKNFEASATAHREERLCGDIIKVKPDVRLSTRATTPNYTHFAMSPDNRYAAVAARKTMRLFDLLNFESGSFLPRSRYAHYDPTCSIDTIYDYYPPRSQTFRNDTGDNGELAFTRDGSHLISTSSGYTLRNKRTVSTAFYIHSLRDGRIRRSRGYKDPKKFINGKRSIAINPVHNRFAIATGPEIRIHNFKGKFLREILSGLSDSISTIKYSPDGRSVFSGGSDWRIHLWDIETGANTTNFIIKHRSVSSMAVSPDGNTLVATDGYYSNKRDQIYAWDTRTGKEIQKFDSTQRIINLAFNHKGKLISASPSTVKMWSDKMNPKPVYTSNPEWHSDFDESYDDLCECARCSNGLKRDSTPEAYPVTLYDSDSTSYSTSE